MRGLPVIDFIVIFSLPGALAAANPYALTDLPFFLLLPVLLLLSGFFSGSETAMFSLSAQARARLTRGGGVTAHVLDQMLADTQMLLITLMFGNMLINVLYFVISSALLLKLPGETHGLWIAAGTPLSLILIIIFGEVLPKMIANLSPQRWVRITAVPLFAVHNVIGPLRLLLRSYIIAPLGRLFAPRLQPTGLSTAELDSLVRISQRRGVIDRGEEQLLREVVHLSQLKVRDVMVPRVDIQAFDLNDPPEQLYRLIRERRLTKVPVYRGDLDHVEGVVFARQFLLSRASGGSVDMDKLVRQVRFVPELQRVDQLLSEFRKRHVHLAVVVDEFGGTAGLVTLRDVVERLVGEVDFQDEAGPRAEADEQAAEPLGAGRWRVSGRLPVRDWAQTFGQENIPPRVATIGGLVNTLLGHIPRAGETARLGNLTLRVERMDGSRVGSVILALESKRAPAEGAGS